MMHSTTIRSRSTGGSVQIVQSGAALVAAARINGDLFFDSNDRFLAAIGNRIGGNLQAFQNSGGLAVIHNTIDGNLQCKANNPAPFGGENVVHGNKEDQCANLTREVVYVPLVGHSDVDGGGLGGGGPRQASSPATNSVVSH